MSDTFLLLVELFLLRCLRVHTSVWTRAYWLTGRKTPSYLLTSVSEECWHDRLMVCPTLKVCGTRTTGSFTMS